MIKVTFITKGKGLDSFIVSLNKSLAEQKSLVNNLGKETAEKMREIINQNKVRPQAGEPKTLEKNIDVEFFDAGDRYGWGVGNIEKLNTNAKYWRAVNYGSSHMVGKKMPMGQFNPGNPQPQSQNTGDGRWQGGNFVATVTKPIPAMNYIEKTVFVFKSRAKALTRAFTRR